MSETIASIILGLAGSYAACAIIIFIMDQIRGVLTYRHDREYIMEMIAQADTREMQIIKEAFNRRYPNRKIE